MMTLLLSVWSILLSVVLENAHSLCFVNMQNQTQCLCGKLLPIYYRKINFQHVLLLHSATLHISLHPYLNNAKLVHWPNPCKQRFNTVVFYFITNKKREKKH